ncbi:MAG TPA: hypothetical protein VLH77_00100 [Gammaproteobacteria bacterium]|nr:hypothetical protein [Gammaproteobacteria bacterium]
MKKILIYLFTFFFSSLSFAAIPPQPEKCPGVTAIQKTDFLVAQKLSNDSYGAIQISPYDTNETWGLVMAEIPASSVQEALKKAKAALNSLSFKAGPAYFSQNNIWGCVYAVSEGYGVVSLTPLPA